MAQLTPTLRIKSLFESRRPELRLGSTEPYIEALLVDEDLADWVWEALDAEVIDDELAIKAWFLLAA